MNYDPNTLILFLTHRGLPARLNVEQTAEILGFTTSDLTILSNDAAVSLKPLGSPAQNAPKYFAAVEVLNLASDARRLHRATEVIRKYHLHKRSAKRLDRVKSRDQTSSTASSFQSHNSLEESDAA